MDKAREEIRKAKRSLGYSLGIQDACKILIDKQFEITHVQNHTPSYTEDFKKLKELIDLLQEMRNRIKQKEVMETEIY